MKRTEGIWIYFVSIQVVFLLFASGCSSNDNLALLTTASVSNIEVATALSGGTISSDGGTPVIVHGVCWSTSKAPTIADGKTADGAGTGSFSSYITGLTANTTYYVRAYATNSGGTAYGNESNFKTFGVIDIDGNKYYSVVIGAQEWMKENLRTTKYANGDLIPNVTGITEWSAITTGAWSYYTNDEQFNEPYGKLYNGYAIIDSKKICPNGWHVASDSEWTILENYIGGSAPGGALKEAGTTHWLSPNTGATNSSGYTALPGGYRGGNGEFPFVGLENLGSLGLWWSSTEFDANNLWIRTMGKDSDGLDSQDGFSKAGLSCRCIKD